MTTPVAIPTQPHADAARRRIVRDIIVDAGRGVTIAQVNTELSRNGRRKTNIRTFGVVYQEVHGTYPTMEQCRGKGTYVPVATTSNVVDPLGPTDRLRLLGYAVPTTTSPVEEHARAILEVDAAGRFGVMVRFVLAVEAIGGAARARRYLDVIERGEKARRVATMGAMEAAVPMGSDEDDEHPGE